jgi:hypothetical protein
MMMPDQIPKEEKEGIQESSWLAGLGIAIGLILVGVVWATYPAWLPKFYAIHAGKLDTLGTFGDSFGALNALFSGAAFAVLVGTLLLQRQELKLQRKELREARIVAAQQALALESQDRTLRKQTFESFLVQWATLLNKIVEDTQYLDKKGRVALGLAYSHIVGESINRLRQRVDGLPNEFALDVAGWAAWAANNTYPGAIDGHVVSTDLATQIAGLSTNQLEALLGVFRESLQTVNERNTFDFDHYHRVLYRLLRLILLGEWSADEKREYLGLVRAQISQPELCLLLLNCLLPHGHNMKVLAEHCALFDNYQRKHDPLFVLAISGKTMDSSAFSTDQARRKAARIEGAQTPQSLGL